MEDVFRSNENVTGVVPLLLVTEMERSLRYYEVGLGFTVQNKWVVDGKLLWCWLGLGGASLMLQELTPVRKEASGSALGVGVGLWLQCRDAIALYREVTARGILASEPQVGNRAWEVLLRDPDGYLLHFSSPLAGHGPGSVDLPEETLLSQTNL